MSNNNLKPTDVYIELNESVTRIEVFFKFDPDKVRKIKTFSGRHFDWDTKIWSLPMEMQVARRLRELYGKDLKLGPALRAWAKSKVQEERNMRSLHSATDATLSKTPRIILDVIEGKPMGFADLPKNHALNKTRPERPYQRADIKLMSIASAMNCNDVGTGKTLEVIGAIHEARINPKPVIVIAPRRSLVNVWQEEFERLSKYKVFTSESPAQRHKAMQQFLTAQTRNNKVIALIPDDVRLIKYYDIKKPAPTEEHALHACRDHRGNWYRFKTSEQQKLFMVEYGALIIDEFHNTGLNNRNSLFFMAMKQFQASRKWPMSATPIGGKPRRLWPVLHFLDPKGYSSEWRWIEEWLEVTTDEVHFKGGGRQTRTVRNVGGIKEETEEEFYNFHAKHMVRRTKKDALPGLPDAVEILVETPMEGQQKIEYDVFDQEHEVVLNGKRLSGAIVLAQYTRLRQMANARLVWDDFYTKPVASIDGCKYAYLLERLDENGIRKATPDNPAEPGARAYIGVLDKGLLTATIDYLERNGISCGRLDGDTKDSKPIIDRFNDDHPTPYVICMTIQTGGTALNLERANSAHALDEAWDPDVMHQFFGRGDRGSRDTALKCYTYRTPDSIQDYVAQVAGDKKITNKTVLNYVKDIERLRSEHA